MTILLALAIASAADIAPACPVLPDWAMPQDVHAGLNRALPFALQTDKAYRIALAPAPAVALAVRSRRIPKAGSFAGMAAIDVSARGKLTIILSNATYVDVARGSVALKSVAHADLKECAGMRKSVSFNVVPGRYLVQLIDAPERSVVLEAVLG